MYVQVCMCLSMYMYVLCALVHHVVSKLMQEQAVYQNLVMFEVFSRPQSCVCSVYYFLRCSYLNLYSDIHWNFMRDIPIQTCYLFDCSLLYWFISPSCPNSCNSDIPLIQTTCSAVCLNTIPVLSSSLDHLYVSEILTSTG